MKAIVLIKSDNEVRERSIETATDIFSLAAELEAWMDEGTQISTEVIRCE